MSTIQIRKETKEKLSKYADGRSMNAVIGELVQDAPKSDKVDKAIREYSNIRIDSDVLQELKKCKIHTAESHSDVIERLLANKMSDD